MSNPLIIPDQLTLPALQQHIDDVCQHMGWTSANTDQLFLLFIEEVGELAKAMRNVTELGIEVGKAKEPAIAKAELAAEFADVLNYLADLANRFGVDLDAAYRSKMTFNLTRSFL